MCLNQIFQQCNINKTQGFVINFHFHAEDFAVGTQQNLQYQATNLTLHALLRKRDVSFFAISCFTAITPTVHFELK